MDDWLHPPASGGEARVVVGFPQGTGSGGAGAAFDAADNLAVDIRAEGETLLAETIPVSAGGGSIETRFDVLLSSGVAQAQLSVEVRRGSDALFTGSVPVVLSAGEEVVATIPLDPVVADLALTPPPRFTVYGQTADLEGDPVFATGDVVPGLEVAWSSLAPDVVAVERVGGGWRAVALADGTATLRATLGNRSSTVPAEVRAVVTDVEVVPGSVDLIPGATAELTAVLRDAGGSPVPDRTPTWASSDDAVATVSATGTVTALAPGTAEITATADGASGAAAVGVRRPGPEIETLAPTGITASGATLRARVDPMGATTTVVFEYGPDPDLSEPSTASPVVVSGSSGTVDVGRTVAGLPPSSTWYVRAVASNSQGDAAGEIVSFTTLAAPSAPTALAGAFTGGVRLTWVDNSSDETRFEIERELVQGSGSTPGATDGPLRIFRPIATVGADATQFEDTSPPTGEMRYRVRACNGAACSDWTPPLTWFYGLPPRVQTRPAANVGTGQALISAFVNPLNAPTLVYWELAFEPSFTTPPPTMEPTSPVDAGAGNIDVIRSTLAQFLQPGSTYYVRAVAYNTWGSTTGPVLSFMTAGGG